MKKLQKFSKPVIMAVMTAVMALSVCMAYLGATEKASATELAHFSSVTGGQVTESDILSGDTLTGRRLDIVPDVEDGTVTFEYDGVFSAADMMDGEKSIFSFTINDMATVADRKFSVIAITMEDMMNPEEQIVYSLGQYGIAGKYLDFFAARIGYSDTGLTEDAQYSALYSTYKDMFVYHTAIDNNISPGGYALNGNLIAADIRTFFIRYNNTAGSRDISLLPNRDGNYINNIDSQQVYHEGAYKHIEIPELFTSGYYKLKFQILGAKSGLSITLNGDMDASTVPFTGMRTVGAAIRIEGEGSIRFVSEFLKGQLEKLDCDYYKIGTVLKGGELTAEQLTVDTVGAVKIENQEGYWQETENKITISGYIYGIDQAHYGSNISARAYIELHKGDSVTYMYSDVIIRSLSEVAAAALNDVSETQGGIYIYDSGNGTYSPYDEETRTKLQSYVI